MKTISADVFQDVTTVRALVLQNLSVNTIYGVFAFPSGVVRGGSCVMFTLDLWGHRSKLLPY